MSKDEGNSWIIHPSDNAQSAPGFSGFFVETDHRRSGNPSVQGKKDIYESQTRHSNLGGSNQDHAELCVMVNSRESGLNIGQYPIRVLTFAKKRFFNYTGSLLSRSPISRKCEGLVPANQTFAN